MNIRCEVKAVATPTLIPAVSDAPRVAPAGRGTVSPIPAGGEKILAVRPSASYASWHTPVSPRETGRPVLGPLGVPEFFIGVEKLTGPRRPLWRPPRRPLGLPEWAGRLETGEEVKYFWKWVTK